MESIVIVGCGELGGLVFEFLSHDPLYQVAGFAVEHQYLNESTCCSRPVVDLDKLPDIYPPDRHQLFVAIYSNAERKRVFLKCRAMGYHFLTYKAPNASVSPSAKLGENVIVMENSSIQYHAEIGENTFIWNGVNICHSAVIGENSWIAPGATVAGISSIGNESFIGANATIKDRINIAGHNTIGAGAVVVKPIEGSHGVYAGCPAKLLKRVLD